MSKACLTILLAACLVCPALSAARADGVLPEEEMLSDHEMETLRGGGIMAGGMIMDFSLFQKTLINGELQAELQLDSNEIMSQLDMQDMHRLIEVGNGNVPLSSVQDIPGIVTVIRNSADDSLIQNMGDLNLDVSNIAAVRQGAITPLLEFQIIGAMH